MTGKLLSSVAFLTTIFALQNAQSAEIPQALTIDRLSAETADFLNNSEIASPYELQTTKADETDVVVRIDGTTYYFTPANAKQGAALQTLADIGSAALKELPDSNRAIYSWGGKYYGYDTQKLPKSGYSLSEVSSKDAEGLIITKYTKNSDNALSEKYYRVDVKQPESGRKVYTTHQDSLSGQGDVDADFIGIKMLSGSYYGAAIYNAGGWDPAIIGNITGNFINNHGQERYMVGGAIYNCYNGKIGNITGDFIGNIAQSVTSDYGYARGGAVYNSYLSSVDNITGDFIANSAQAKSGIAEGGAIYNGISIYVANSTIGNISGNFINNYAQSEISYARGGAIHNEKSATIKNIINSNFIGNYVKGNEDSVGGAIWSDSDILVTADAGTSLFSGNKANDKSNAIYMSGTTRSPIALNLSAVNNGTITFDDGIDGINYNINVTGDGSGVVVFNNLVENVSNFTLSDNSVVHLGLNADIQTQNMSVATGSTLVGKNAVSSPIITVDVEVDKADNTVNSGAIHIANDISGDYRVLVNAVNSDVLDNKDDAVVPFLFAPNDKEDTSSSFSVARVIGSPYLWMGDVNAKGEEAGSTWYLNLTDILNPDYKPEEPSKPVVRPVAPEVIAGAGLHEAAIEQTRSLVRNVRTKVADGRVYCPGCGLYNYAWNGNKLRNVWVNVQGETATLDKPVKMDADIWGIEAGFDVQNDINNTLGVFASYRKGEYDLSGKADKVRSNIGSEIDINSYLAGLYYRYDKNMNWLFATVYGGVQQADAKTDDGIAKFDTDGVEFGAAVEAGHTFALSSDLTLDPSLGLYYTQVNFDDAKDNVGKEYDWKDVKHLEAELGAKLEKQIDAAKVYVKPSVIQTITSGDSVKITGLNYAW